MQAVLLPGAHSAVMTSGIFASCLCQHTHPPRDRAKSQTSVRSQYLAVKRRVHGFNPASRVNRFHR